MFSFPDLCDDDEEEFPVFDRPCEMSLLGFLSGNNSTPGCAWRGTVFATLSERPVFGRSVTESCGLSPVDLALEALLFSGFAWMSAGRIWSLADNETAANKITEPKAIRPKWETCLTGKS